MPGAANSVVLTGKPLLRPVLPSIVDRNKAKEFTPYALVTELDT